MNQMELKRLLEKVAAGDVDVTSALLRFRDASESERAAPSSAGISRSGSPETIRADGKTAAQIAGTVDMLRSVGQRTVLITRLEPGRAEELRASVPLIYSEMGKIGVAGGMPEKSGLGTIIVVTASTGDMPVAEEAAITAEALGNEVTRLYDLGSAGYLRLLARSAELRSARVIIAISGMDGSLAGMIGSLTDCPVIAVPTSSGYGASFGGLSALLGMLNSCADGVSVVNIDNGFGAGYLASRINHLGNGK